MATIPNTECERIKKCKTKQSKNKNIERCRTCLRFKALRCISTTSKIQQLAYVTKNFNLRCCRGPRSASERFHVKKIKRYAKNCGIFSVYNPCCAAVYNTYSIKSLVCLKMFHSWWITWKWRTWVARLCWEVSSCTRAS